MGYFTPVGTLNTMRGELTSRFHLSFWRENLPEDSIEEHHLEDLSTEFDNATWQETKPFYLAYHDVNNGFSNQDIAVLGMAYAMLLRCEATPEELQLYTDTFEEITRDPVLRGKFTDEYIKLVQYGIYDDLAELSRKYKKEYKKEECNSGNHVFIKGFMFILEGVGTAILKIFAW